MFIFTEVRVTANLHSLSRSKYSGWSQLWWGLIGFDSSSDLLFRRSPFMAFGDRFKGTNYNQFDGIHFQYSQGLVIFFSNCSDAFLI